MSTKSTPARNRSGIQRVMLIALAVCLPGCGSSTENPQPQAPSNQVAPAIPSSLPASSQSQSAASSLDKANPVTLQLTDLKGYETILSRQLGNVVLVDFWATWCAPCAEQFPHTVELDQKFRAQGLVVVSVSIDQAKERESLDQLQSRILAFLKQHNAAILNIAVPVTELAPGDRAADALIAERFDLPGGSIPHYKLYDRQGNLQQKFFVDPQSGKGVNLQELDAAIENLLAN